MVSIHSLLINRECIYISRITYTCEPAHSLSHTRAHNTLYSPFEPVFHSHKLLSKLQSLASLMRRVSLNDNDNTIQNILPATTIKGLSNTHQMFKLMLFKVVCSEGLKVFLGPFQWHQEVIIICTIILRFFSPTLALSEYSVVFQR